jgi:hypothetical protein
MTNDLLMKIDNNLDEGKVIDNMKMEESFMTTDNKDAMHNIRSV